MAATRRNTTTTSNSSTEYANVGVQVNQQLVAMTDEEFREQCRLNRLSSPERRTLIAAKKRNQSRTITRKPSESEHETMHEAPPTEDEIISSVGYMKHLFGSPVDFCAYLVEDSASAEVDVFFHHYSGKMLALSKKRSYLWNPKSCLWVEMSHMAICCETQKSLHHRVKRILHARETMESGGTACGDEIVNRIAGEAGSRPEPQARVVDPGLKALRKFCRSVGSDEKMFVSRLSRVACAMSRRPEHFGDRMNLARECLPLSGGMCLDLVHREITPRLKEHRFTFESTIDPDRLQRYFDDEKCKVESRHLGFEEKAERDASLSKVRQFFYEVMSEDHLPHNAVHQKTDYLCCQILLFISGFFVNSQLFMWFSGPEVISGANGKSVIVNVLKAIMGSFCMTLAGNFASRRQTTGAATTALNGIQNVRLAIVSEPDKNSHPDVAFLKQLSSGEYIPMRNMYEEAKQVKVEANLLTVGNEPPKYGKDQAYWRRVIMTIFFRKFVPKRYLGDWPEGTLEADPRMEEWMLSHLEAFVFFVMTQARQIMVDVNWDMSSIPVPPEFEIFKEEIQVISDPLQQWVTSTFKLRLNLDGTLFDPKARLPTGSWKGITPDQVYRYYDAPGRRIRRENRVIDTPNTFTKEFNNTYLIYDDNGKGKKIMLFSTRKNSGGGFYQIELIDPNYQTSSDRYEARQDVAELVAYNDLVKTSGEEPTTCNQARRAPTAKKLPSVSIITNTPSKNNNRDILLDEDESDSDY
jgi:hypothetical protein